MAAAIRTVAKVVVVNREGKVLLLRRSKNEVRRPLEWDIPGGHAGEGEFAEEAAVRETREETGVELPARGLRLAYAVSHTFEDGLHVTWLFYVAYVENPAIAISLEHTEYAWKDLDEAVAAISYDRQKKAFEYLRASRLL